MAVIRARASSPLPIRLAPRTDLPTLDQPDQRQAQLVGHLLAHDVLFLDRGVGRAAADAEVAAAADRASVDPGTPEDEVRGQEVLEVVAAVIGREAGDGPDLVEAAGIDQGVDALADREASAVALAPHAHFPAEPVRGGLAAVQFVELRLPVHGGPFRYVASEGVGR